MTKSCTRLYSLDLSRWIAAFLVICIHTVPLSSFSRLGNALFVQVVCRLAVPFFFVCSGYFLFRIASISCSGAVMGCNP